MAFKDKPAPIPPPPPAPTPEQLEAVGLRLDATPVHNANCDASASSQSKSNGSFNRDLWDRYRSAVDSYQTQPQGRDEPPAPRPPSLDGKWEPGAPYYRLEDRNALYVFCMNDREVPYNAADDTWNYSATKY